MVVISWGMNQNHETWKFRVNIWNKPELMSLFMSQLWRCLYQIRSLFHWNICSLPSPSYFWACCLVPLSGLPILPISFSSTFLSGPSGLNEHDSFRRASDEDSEKAGPDVSYYVDMVPEELVLFVGMEHMRYCSTNTSCHTFHRPLGSVVYSHTPIIHHFYDGATLYTAGGWHTSLTVCCNKEGTQSYSTAANYSSHICWPSAWNWSSWLSISLHYERKTLWSSW